MHMRPRGICQLLRREVALFETPIAGQAQNKGGKEMAVDVRFLRARRKAIPAADEI